MNGGKTDKFLRDMIAEELPKGTYYIAPELWKEMEARAKKKLRDEPSSPNLKSSERK